LILYLDTSAVVKAYVEEEYASEVRQSMESASASASHRIAYVEARAAFARLQREQVLNDAGWKILKDEFKADWENYLLIDTTSELLEKASELAEAFALRAYDSVHLAAAQLLHEDAEESVVFACYDRKLNQAAMILGLDLLHHDA